MSFRQKCPIFMNSVMGVQLRWLQAIYRAECTRDDFASCTCFDRLSSHDRANVMVCEKRKIAEASKKKRNRSSASNKKFQCPHETTCVGCLDSGKCENETMNVECSPKTCMFSELGGCTNTRFTRRQYAATKVAPSERKGHGLFARSRIELGVRL